MALCRGLRTTCGRPQPKALRSVLGGPSLPFLPKIPLPRLGEAEPNLVLLRATRFANKPGEISTYDHRVWRTGLPVRSAVLKPHAGRSRMLCIRRKWSARDAKKGWLPPSLRRPYLLALSLLLLLIALVVEILRQLSNRHNGLVQYRKKEDLSSSAWQVWANTPTIVALVALVLWEAFAQDALRLEPYFQLANPNGAPATVLFINYNFDAGILKPIRAACNRHWLILCISSMSLLIQHPIPSLLSGLFTLTPLQVLETRTVETWPQLMGLDTQENWFSIKAAYGNASWNPRVICPQEPGNSRYATAPVSILADYNDWRSSLTLNQSVYWSDMTCRNATVTGALPGALFNATTTEDPTIERGLSWNLSSLAMAWTESTSRCDIGITLDTLIPFGDGSFQARYWEPVQSRPTLSSQFALNVTDCPSAGLLGIMIDTTMSAGALLESNVIAFACQPVYRQAIANISLSYNSTLTAVDIIPSTVRDLSSTEFSSHGFQNLMYSERAATGFLMDKSATNPSRHISPGVVVVGSTESLPLTQYQEQIGHIWNDQFLDAINTLFDQQALAFRVDAKILTYPVAITVISQTAVMVELIMLLGFVLLLSLSYVYHRRLNLLQEDPSSIAAQYRLISCLMGPQTLHTLSNPSFHVARTRELRKWAKGLWCKWATAPGNQRIELCSKDGSPGKMHSLPAASARRDPMPHFLTLPWFMTECVLLLASVTAFGLASQWMQIHTQASFVSTKLKISAIFLVYGPTMLASMVYSLSNSLHRHLSVAEPWIRLRKGLVSSKRLSAPSYGPLTALCASMRSGPRPPATVLGLSLLCLLNLILVIVSGGLFEPQLITSFASPANLTTVYNTSTFIDQALGPDFQSYDRTIYPWTMSLSDLPWTTSNISFLPFMTDEPEDSTGVQSTATTRGFGTSLTCEVVSSTHAITDYNTRTVNWTYSPSSEPSLQCHVSLPLTFAPDAKQPSIQYTWPDISDCQKLTFFVSASISTDGHTSTALYCSPHLTMESFEVEASPAGQILKHTSIPTDPPLTTSPLYQNLSTALGSFNQNLGSFIHNLTIHPHPLPYYLSSFPHDQTTNLYQKAYENHNNGTVEDLIYSIQLLYQRTFANYITLHRTQLFPQSPPVAIPGNTMYTTWGFMPSTTSIVIIMMLMSVDILCLVTVFLCYYNRYDAPRIPKAIGSLVPWVGGMMGQMIDDDGEHQYHLRPDVNTDGEKIWVLEVDGGMELVDR
ncbi:hypothetical protein BO78DRAFT_470848 [Aspergillus sclerotiicarbonarius CBS 121057]|uniref:Uncharacterized protein n=1 Tax=Aspergillus sclerotiicarbonarius (strain CBS 121057 / IBT 28362) TaxID=1448318 RepID=A0A319EUE4_ASPSB|nr:hypothetical protein BO78DRAFT_470848 [Aspergillus sclerotiicarbonarius CBS 121057]